MLNFVKTDLARLHTIANDLQLETPWINLGTETSELHLVVPCLYRHLRDARNRGAAPVDYDGIDFRRYALPMHRCADESQVYQTRSQQNFHDRLPLPELKSLMLKTETPLRSS